MIKINNEIFNKQHFPDKTQLLKFNTENLNFPIVITWHYENDEELFTLICIKKHLDEHSQTLSFIQLDLVYLPNGRMDRVKNKEDIFTLKYFCEIINSLNFNRVRVLDAHSNVGLALLDRVIEIRPWDYIEKTIQEIYDNYLPDDDTLMLFYPDEGAMKRYSSALSLPFAFGVKRRNWETGVIEGLDLMGEVDMVASRNVLIIDDICSKGGTFYHSAKRLKEAGAENIYLYVTHCENTIYEGELLKEDSLIKHIFTTNSLLTAPNEKMTIVE